MSLSCVECKPCNGHCLPGPPGALFKSRRPAQLLCRALGKMKVGGTRRRPRRPGSFSSVRAVFWPLMSMRSEADARNDDTRPPTDSSPDVTVSSGGARAPSPSMQDDDGVGAPGGATSTTTAARVLALQTRLGGEGEAAVGDEAKAIVVRHGGDVEAACRSFERHLMEMLVEERKVMDLTDVEELLCCWEQLTCPAFVRLVGRFYGELCMDLFSSAQDADDVWSSPPVRGPERLTSESHMDMGNQSDQKRPFCHEPMTHQSYCLSCRVVVFLLCASCMFLPVAVANFVGFLLVLETFQVEPKTDRKAAVGARFYPRI
ncbi:uncharacterized protein [Miscanthus floridulus]|uniref:uncharacterized protein n=1 Tax=Miscanthus floridulus TaxID=154761 RepID=UPI00345B3566